MTNREFARFVDSVLDRDGVSPAMVFWARWTLAWSVVLVVYLGVFGHWLWTHRR